MEKYVNICILYNATLHFLVNKSVMLTKAAFIE